MLANTSQRKSSAAAGIVDVREDQYKRKLQRILRSNDQRSPGLSGGVGNLEPRMSFEQKQAMLSPKLVNPSSVPEDDTPLFQCTQCDMIVRETDSYCPFCGAIFADGEQEPEEPEEREEKPVVERPRIEKPARREPMVRPEMFDLFSLVRAGSRSRDMLYQEALKGFAGSARLLEEIERLISDVSSIGADTSRARRLVGSAWEAARDGNWNLVTALARQTEEVVAPNIPDLVRSEVARARSFLAQAKAVGVDISPYVVRVKSVMQSLRSGDPDEALRLTKELMDSLREDSISWK